MSLKDLIQDDKAQNAIEVLMLVAAAIIIATIVGLIVKQIATESGQRAATETGETAREVGRSR